MRETAVGENRFDITLDMFTGVILVPLDGGVDVI